MKYLCLLFSLFILLVSAAPCCSDDCGPGEAPAAQAGQPGDAHPERGEGKACSPFLTCGACAGFIKPVPVPTLPVEICSYQAALVDAYYFSCYPLVPSSFWQPPRVG